jgi:N-acetylglucosaminyldiphosphoundecaprenol N-acetyl-beta-D-mannosaminyltransferase
MSGEEQRVDILGVGVSPVSLTQAAERIELWCRQGQRTYVCVCGVHGIVESQHDLCLRSIYDGAGMVTPDGMPLVWVSHLKGFPAVTRVYGPDLMLELCRRSAGRADGLKHFFYGGAPGVAQSLASRLTARFPGLQVAGTYSPAFNSAETIDQPAVACIAASGADVVWVGLGAPKQERWMAAHCAHLGSVLIGIGAAFDFLSGRKRQAPRWMMRAGLEWAFRLAQEPVRLAPRYGRIIPQFLWLLALQALSHKPQSV